MLKRNYQEGISTICISFINSFKHPRHEIKIKSIAKNWI